MLIPDISWLLLLAQMQVQRRGGTRVPPAGCSTGRGGDNRKGASYCRPPDAVYWRAVPEAPGGWCQSSCALVRSMLVSSPACVCRRAAGGIDLTPHHRWSASGPGCTTASSLGATPVGDRHRTDWDHELAYGFLHHDGVIVDLTEPVVEAQRSRRAVGLWNCSAIAETKRAARGLAVAGLDQNILRRLVSTAADLAYPPFETIDVAIVESVRLFQRQRLTVRSPSGLLTCTVASSAARATHMSDGCVAMHWSLAPRMAWIRLTPSIAGRPLPGSRLLQGVPAS